MFRVLEVLGLLAPLGGAVLLYLYRKRSRPAFAWGTIACIMGIAASGIGLFGARVSITSAFMASEGIEGALERLDMWALVRFGLLMAAGVLLVVAALADRQRDKPVSWIVTGLILMGGGVGMHFVSLDMGGEHERLTLIVGMFIEMAQAGLLGAGFLAFCIAVIAHRPGTDGRRDPTELAARVGTTAWRIYADSRRGSGR